jgi:hypothetical protein
VCGDFTFIGCFPPRDDFCHVWEVRSTIGHCRRLPFPRCSLGFVGNGRICQGRASILLVLKKFWLASLLVLLISLRDRRHRKPMENRTNASKIEKSLADFIRKYIKFRLFHHSTPKKFAQTFNPPFPECISPTYTCGIKGRSYTKGNGGLLDQWRNWEFGAYGWA